MIQLDSEKCVFAPSYLNHIVLEYMELRKRCQVSCTVVHTVQDWWEVCDVNLEGG